MNMEMPKHVRMAHGFMSSVESQEAFRSILKAMSRPGRITETGRTLAPPAPMYPAFGAVCLTLLDYETPFWTDLPDHSPALTWLRFHCGAPRTRVPRDAWFVLITRFSSLSTLERFHPGEEERPERGATVVVQVEDMGNERGARLSGPGIETEARLWVKGLPALFWEERMSLGRRFPLGLDFIFASRHDLAALPRSTRIEE